MKMKRIINIISVLAASLAILCACEQEDPAAISVNPAAVVLDSGDSFAEVEVVSTGAWSAELSYSGGQSGWLSVSSVTGSGDRTVRVSASANDGVLDAPARQVLVVFSTTGIGGTVTATLNVIQSAAE